MNKLIRGLRSILGLLLTALIIASSGAVHAQVSGNLSANPNRCDLPRGQSLCSTQITWSSQNTQMACVWKAAPAPGQLWACSGPGTQTQTWPWVGTDGNFFELRNHAGVPSGTDAGRWTGTLLASLSVSALPPPLTPTSVKPVTATPNPQALGEPMTLATSVTPVPDGGTLTFYVNSAAVATVPLNMDGNAGTRFTAPAPGTYTAHAVYSGSTQYAVGTSLPSSISVVEPVQTSLQLTSSRNPVLTKQSFALTAQVSPANASGYVTFKADLYDIGSNVVVNGIAALSNVQAGILPWVGVRTITATFTPASKAWTTSSSALKQTVYNGWPTNLTLSASGDPAIVGQSYLLAVKLDLQPNSGAVQIDPRSATGIVYLYDGNTWISTGEFSSGIATFNVKFNQSGAHRLTAAYRGDGDFAGGDSNALTVSVVSPSNTSTSLKVSSDTVKVSQPLQLTAQVSPAMATGTVTFLDGSLVLGAVPVSDGQAQLSTQLNTAGIHPITASFAGATAAYGPSTSPVAHVTVGQSSSSIRLTSSVNPSQLAQDTVLKAVLTPSSATGTVAFSDGSIALGTAAIIDGVATLSTRFNSEGLHTLTASYSGDGDHSAGTSPQLAQRVFKDPPSPTSVILKASAGAMPVGRVFNLSAHVSPAEAPGTVVFFDGDIPLGSAVLLAGVATLDARLDSVGEHALSARFSSTANYAPSTSDVLNLTALSPLATRITITGATDPIKVGQLLTLSAKVTPPEATGEVIFMGQGVALGTARLTAGLATLGTRLASVGEHLLTARYQGGDGYAAATSEAWVQKVVAAETTTLLTSSANPATVGGLVGLNARVSPPEATGQVTFKNGSTVLAAVPLTGGLASLMTNFNTAGTHALTASYAGDANYGPSASAVLDQVVQAQGSTASTTTLSSSINPVPLGAPTQLTARVTPAEATGTVVFLDNGVSLGSATVSAGAARLSTIFKVLGSHPLTAAYSGDGQFAPSASAAMVQTVCPAAAICPTALSLTATPNPVSVGATATLTAKVDPPEAEGSVSFMDGDTTLGSAALNAGVASLSTSFNVVGNRTLVARYAGTPSWASSTSLSMTLKVTGSSTPTVTFFHNDIAGTPLMATDATGRPLWKESYRPFGERTVNTGPGGAVANANNSLWFTGKSYEPSTGLSYMGARYYAPALGRFIGMDPKEVDPEDVHSFNRYAYANNNPFKYVDSDGRSPVLLIPLVWTVGNAAISGAFNAATQYLSTGQVQWRGVGGVLDAAGDGAIMGPALGAVSGLAGGSAAVESSRAPAAKGGAANIAAHEAYKDGLRAAMSKPAVSDPALARLIDPLYRPNATVGSGSTAAAIRQELATGQPVGGAFHSQKAADSIRSLERWLSNNPAARTGDRAAAENVIKDMSNALGGR